VGGNAQWARLQDALRKHYEQWRVLTEAEGAAITANEWGTVAELQQTKRQLQTLITNTLRELREGGNHHGLAAADIEKEFRPRILNLLEMENINGEVLAARRKGAAQKREHVDRVVHSLRQLRRAYAHGRPSLWETYS